MQLDEMGKAVDVAEKQMLRFGLTQQEVVERRKWVQAARRQVDSAAARALSVICLVWCSLQRASAGAEIQRYQHGTFAYLQSA